jgi:crotonobetainyl-CoA:carnitine CoA-transferase CaiB-like acyl-CoA transferase
VSPPSTLGGLRVIDLTSGFAGALVSVVLADYGADVVKVEPPGRPDRPGSDPVRRHPAFPMWHRGKRSVVLDLRKDGGRRQARRLAAQADIVVQSYRPGVAERLGLGYDALASENPGLIYAAITAMGSKGPYAWVKGYDGIAAAKMGAMGHSSDLAPQKGRPAYPAVPWASFSASQTALQGILAALYVRQRTGQGQRVETTLVQGLAAQDPWNQFLLWLTETYPQAYRFTPPVPVKDAPFTDYIYRLLVAMTKDGRWLQFSQTSPHLWDAMVQALDMQHIYEDPGFKTAPVMETYEDSVRLWDLMLEKVRSRTYAEWEAHFKSFPDVGAELFRTAREAMDHPQMLHNRHVMEYTDPRVGKTRQLAPIVRMFATPGEIQRPAPELGEHTQAVLASLNGARARQRPRQVGAAPLPKHALDGVTIVELGLFYASPFGLTLLADLGARVIKLEPLRGDDIRRAMPIPETGAVKVLQGKESVAVDIEKAEGQAIAHRIIAKADLVMMGFRGGVAQRLRVDYPALRAINPRLVYLNAPGYGVDGPYARKPAYAPTIGAGIGSAMSQAGPGVFSDDPARLTLDQIKAISLRLRSAASGPGNADGVSSLAVGTALLLGLVARERTGIAQEMLTSMLSSTAWANSADMIEYEGKPPAPAPDPELWGLGPLYRLYPAAGGWVFLAAVQEDEWLSLADAVAKLGGPSLARDSRFSSAALRRTNGAALAEALGRFFKTRPSKDWEAALRPFDVGCVDVAPGPMHRFALRDPIMLENGFVDEVEHPVFGRHPRLGPLVALSKTPGLSRPAVTVGQHTERVLQEFGYGEAEIARLEGAGVIRCAR